jgi:uncharacterized membrane protein
MSDLFKEKDRIESFSDGVFAIAITLLGLELKVPKLSVVDASSMWQTLGAQWHSYVAIVISFVTIFLIWIPHHVMLKIAHNVSYNLFPYKRIFIVGNYLLSVCDRVGGRIF